jgi:hypothetical protein
MKWKYNLGKISADNSSTFETYILSDSPTYRYPVIRSNPEKYISNSNKLCPLEAGSLQVLEVPMLHQNRPQKRTYSSVTKLSEGRARINKW